MQQLEQILLIIFWIVCAFAALTFVSSCWIFFAWKPRSKRTPWRPSAIVDAKLSGDEETQKILDECERAIS
jgi:hypothetical protein